MCDPPGNKPEPSVSGIKNIKTKISSLKLQDVNVDLDIGSVDAQESKDGKHHPVKLFYNEVIAFNGSEGRYQVSARPGRDSSSLLCLNSLVGLTCSALSPRSIGGVIVLVTGVITRKWERPRQFVQSFFLARQENNGMA